MSISQKQLTIDLNGQIQSAAMVSLDFNALPGSNPKDFGYFAAIWQGDHIQDLNAAQQTQNLTTPFQAGGFNFEKLEINNLDYIIGFGVNNKSGTSICATINIEKGTPQFNQLNNSLSSLTLQNHSNNSLIASFITPAYNMPATNKNWVALFKGSFTANMYKGINVIKTTMISGDTNEGAVSMNNIPGGLIRFQRYALIYGMGQDVSGNPDFSNLISATEFNVA